MDIVTTFVSRDKLLEWEMFATEQQFKVHDDIFSGLRLHGLILSVIVFGVSLCVPVITPEDPAAHR
jgi:hypothetical protein